MDPLPRWTERAWAAELPAAKARLEGALSEPPSEASLRGLAASAAAIGPVAAAQGAALSEALTDAVVAQLQWALEGESPAACFDAAHTAAELGLRGATGLIESLGKVAQPKGKRPPSVRARAIEAFGALAPETDAARRLEAAQKDDPSWTVRRLAGEALQQRQRGADATGPSLFHRYDALTRCGRLRAEVGDDPIAAGDLAELGLRLPATYLAFLAGTFPGGRLVHVDDDAKGKERDGLHLRLTPPGQLDLGGPRPGDLAGLDEYVWARYVDGARRYPKVDEDFALRRYADHYDRGRVDADAFNYGILLFEAAFRDTARRGALLLRCRDVLLAYRDVTQGEAWDVVDDRLEEVEAIVAEEGLRPPSGACARPLRFGSFDGVVELMFDLLPGDVWARDPDSQPAPWAVAPSAGLLLNELFVPRPGDAGGDDPLGLLARAGREIDAGNKKAAGRLFADALEARKEPGVPEAAAAILQRDDMTPLSAAQLLATVPLAGDRPSAEAVRTVFQALPTAAGEALLEAVAAYDEEGSQIALLVNAAAGIRKRTHASVKEVAKRIRDGRGGGHIRTLRNPWYR